MIDWFGLLAWVLAFFVGFGFGRFADFSFIPRVSVPRVRIVFEKPLSDKVILDKRPSLPSFELDAVSKPRSADVMQKPVRTTFEME